MCQIAFGTYPTPNTKKSSLLDIAYIVKLYHLCPYRCNGTDRCGKPKIIILFDFDVVAVVDDNRNEIIYYFNV